MLRFTSSLALALGALTACSPEVLIASSDAIPGGNGGAAGSRAGAPNGGSEQGGSAMAGEAADGGEPAAIPPARLLADSVSDFSFTQGEHGWFYGSDDGSLENFTLLTRTSVITMFDPVSKDVWDCWANDTTHWTQIFQLGAHPNGTDTSPPSVPVLERAVRRWVSTYAGIVVISGEAAKIDLIGSNGVNVLVYVDGTPLFTQFIAGDDGAGLSYEVRANVRVGSNIDFVLDPHESSDHHDLSRFTGIIARDDTLVP